MLSNALITESLRGLSFAGRPHRDYLLCLVLQAVAVLLWWPKSGKLTTDTPVTLFAMLIALAITLAYHNVRLGAEELTFTEQHSLREWLLSTSVPLRTLLTGYLAGHILQMVYWLLLSAPLLLIAWSVTGSSWLSLIYCLFSIFVLATFYRLIGACVYLALGHYKTLTSYSIRGAVVVFYVMLGLVFPATSHWRLTDELSNPLSSSVGSIELGGFLLFYGLCILLLSSGLSVLAWRIRSRPNL